ncbi:isochorismatase family protein [Acidimangrovimonas sediminis]|uniref:isochorismatase family protein n=1 Tax=Acidimangrovimonas sediminis TaxID=2056283 RepID=UPI000C7FAFAB|nr:isochorismatase family protein [Acidimangrovimonas sediminis]
MTEALLIIDMQAEMQHRIDAGYDCVNPDASGRIDALARAFRQSGRPVIHIRHREADPASPMRPGGAGYPPMPCAEAAPGEAVFDKTTSSAFASTDLAQHLAAAGITGLAVTGAVAGFCVNSSVRAGCDLGLAMRVVPDAVLGFGLHDLSARVIFDVTMAHLAADFATLIDSADLIAELTTEGTATPAGA